MIYLFWTSLHWRSDQKLKGKGKKDDGITIDGRHNCWQQKAVGAEVDGLAGIGGDADAGRSVISEAVAAVVDVDVDDVAAAAAADDVMVAELGDGIDTADDDDAGDHAGVGAAADVAGEKDAGDAVAHPGKIQHQGLEEDRNDTEHTHLDSASQQQVSRSVNSDRPNGCYSAGELRPEDISSRRKLPVPGSKNTLMASDVWKKEEGQLPPMLLLHDLFGRCSDCSRLRGCLRTRMSRHRAGKPRMHCWSPVGMDRRLVSVDSTEQPKQKPWPKSSRM